MVEWRRLILNNFNMPALMRPQAVACDHIIAIDDNGNVVADLPNPEGGYPFKTSLTETKAQLYFSSLAASVLGRIEKEKIVEEHPDKND